MSYKLTFKLDAKKEWDKLGETIRQKFRKKLKERRGNPRVAKDKLHGKDMQDVYKIKLRADGYRLVYIVRDNELVISVISVGKRDKKQVYKRAIERL